MKGAPSGKPERNFAPRTIWTGDNLDILRGLNSETDISAINSQAKERTGYPTQKPLALLNRIIEASSNPGDVVLDRFCGCATACVAADNLQREWIGIDISPKAVELVHMRLRDALGGYTMPGW